MTKVSQRTNAELLEYGIWDRATYDEVMRRMGADPDYRREPLPEPPFFLFTADTGQVSVRKNNGWSGVVVAVFYGEDYKERSEAEVAKRNEEWLAKYLLTND